jgi:hypothetical protein
VRRHRPTLLRRHDLQRCGRALPPGFQRLYLSEVRHAGRPVLRDHPALRRRGHLLPLQHERSREPVHAMRNLGAGLLRR